MSSTSTATAKAFPSAAPGSPSQGTLALRIVLPGVLLALTLLPLLVRHALKLWDRPHYQYFPLVIFGAVLLGRRDTRELGTLTPGKRGMQKSGWIATLAVLTIDVLLGSGWLGMVCLLLLVATLAYTLGGRALCKACLPAWLFLWLVVSVPFNLDALLIVELQKWVALGSSRVLDLIELPHVLLGNTIAVAGRRLLVDEACTGIQSFFSLLAAALFLVLWQRRGTVAACLLVVSSVGWVFAGNVARLVIVGWCAARWKMDLTEGWRHECLGWLIFVAELGLLWSTAQFLYFLTSPDVRWRRRNPMLPPPPPPPVVPSLGPTRLSGLPRTLLTARWLVGAAALLFLLQLLLVGPEWAYALRQDQGDGDRFARLGPDSLPEGWGGWRRDGFESKQRSGGHQLGAASECWYYRRGTQHAAVSLDHPFSDWHELTQCYQGLGWTVSDRQVIHPQLREGRVGPGYVEALLHQPNGLTGYLFWAEVDAAGHDLEPDLHPDTFSILNILRKRLGRREFTREAGLGLITPVRDPRVYQVQLLIESYTPLSAADRDQARGYLDEVRRRLRSTIVPAEEGPR